MADTSASSPGQAVLQFELRFPGSSPVLLNESLVSHVSSVMHETVSNVSVYKHTMIATDTRYVDGLLRLAMSTGTPRMRCRLGVGSPDSTFWLPWQEHVIIDYGASVQGIGNQAGHAFDIVTADVLHFLRRGTRIASHKGRISDIVARILDFFEIENYVVEPTETTGVYIQSLITDESFVRERMLPRARNQKNRGSYHFYARDNVVHFHSVDYQADVKEIVYYQSNQDTLTQVDHSQALIPEGVGGTSIILYDPFSGQSSEVVSRADGAVKMAPSIYALSSVPFVTRNLTHHTTINTRQEAVGLAQNVYETARRKTFAVSLSLLKTIGVRAGDVVRLILSPRDDQASPWSGLYLVAEVGHKIVQGEISTDYLLERGEIQPSRQNTTQENEQSELVSELEAPGQEINLAEMSKSRLTKGAGPQDDRHTFATVTGPDESA